MSGETENELVLVWQITPDPDAIFDHLIVDSEGQAGEAAARAARLSWDDTSREQPGAQVTVQCYEMRRGDFEALPEP